MKYVRLLACAVVALSSAWAGAQDAPESLLPPGFDAPPPPSPAPASPPPAPSPAAPRAARPVAPEPPRSTAPEPRSVATPRVQPLPSSPDSSPAAAPLAPFTAGDRLPPLEVLEKLSPAELERMFGLDARFDVPSAARRSLEGVGIIDESEGGLPRASLAGQDASLVRAALAGNSGVLVSRWGHILLRRALASRLDSPAGMHPADFAALRAALLLRMGEADAARALVQDIETGSYTPALTAAAFDAYVATADFTGICPAMTTQGGTRKDPQWQVAETICDAFRGEGAGALSRLDRALNRGLMPRIDVLLAQKYVGAAGRSRRAVTIEWDGVDEITPWRYGMAIAVGLEPPARLMQAASPHYSYIAATAPMLALASRAAAADRAGAAGVLSSAAMVDLYSQIHAADDITGEWATRAGKLRASYVAASAAARLAAMQELWNEPATAQGRYSRLVLTATAAARLPVSEEFSGSAGDIIASMLAAGLDANALRWRGLAGEGTAAWAQLALVAPASGGVDSGAIQAFADDDKSEDQRRSGFLVAGLAGLGRISPESARSLAGGFGYNIDGETRWTRTITRAAEVGNVQLVALLVGVGMQAESWEKMTPRFLFHIVSALRQVGLEAEARLIAAEAVARG